MTDVERNAILGNVQRQYVGARYVPKFFQGPDGTPTWVGNVPYEALTIVTYLGNSYTSKIPVPAGIGNPSQNPTYWALTGNFNAQVEEILNELKDVRYGRQRQMVCVSDSYGSTDLAVTPFTKILPSRLGLTENVNYAFYGWGGAGFAVPNRTFNTALEAVLKNLPSGMSTDTITDVVVCGGCNDHDYTTEQILAGINNFIQLAKGRCPNAKIYIGCIGGFNDLTRRLQMGQSVIPAYLRAGEYGGVPLLKTYLPMLTKTNFQSDGVHPNLIGSNIIATCVASALNGGYNEVLSYKGTATKDVKFSGGVLAEEYYIMDESVLVSLYTREDFTSETPFTLVGQSTIAVTTNPYIFGNRFFQSPINLRVIRNGSPAIFHASLCLSNNNFLLSVQQTIDNVTAFNFASFSYPTSRIFS